MQKTPTLVGDKSRGNKDTQAQRRGARGGLASGAYHQLTGAGGVTLNVYFCPAPEKNALSNGP